MAQRIQAFFVDDIDGGDAEGTVSFGLDGTSYEIDLNKSNDNELRSALAPYIASARKVTSASVRKTARSGRKDSSDGPSTKEIRAWAEENNIPLKNRGRIPANVVEKYLSATSGT